MDEAETIAMAILETIFPSADIRYRPAQSHGEYDLDVFLPDGSSVAVEVAAWVDQLQAETIGKIRNKGKGGAILPAIECKKTWMITLAKGAPIKPIKRELDHYLSVLEQNGVEHFNSAQSGPKCVHEVCSKLHVQFGRAFSSTLSAKLYIGSPGQGAAIAASIATEAGEREAWKGNNRKKLRAARTSQRLLFVYLDVMNGSPWIALTQFEPPSILANLPKEITKIWLTASSGEGGDFVVWEGSTEQQWRSFGRVRPSSQ